MRRALHEIVVGTVYIALGIMAGNAVSKVLSLKTITIHVERQQDDGDDAVCCDAPAEGWGI